MEYKWVNGKEDGFEHVYALRHEVFVAEQGYTEQGEFDEKDATSRHIVGFEGEVPVCTARIMQDEPGMVHVGRVVVVKRSRGKGYGLDLMKRMVREAEKMGAKTVLVDAQADKTYFYECAGFAVTGGTSLEEGREHVEMKMEL